MKMNMLEDLKLNEVKEMTKKLKKLTAEQEDLISVVRDEWLNPFLDQKDPHPWIKKGVKKELNGSINLWVMKNLLSFFR